MPRFSQSGQVVARRMGDTTVLVHLETERIVELNETGSSIWEALGSTPDAAPDAAQGEVRSAGGKSAEDLVSELGAAYAAPSEQLRAEVEAFLARLRAERLVDVR